jgi:hypothetical protein
MGTDMTAIVVDAPLEVAPDVELTTVAAVARYLSARASDTATA